MECQHAAIQQDEYRVPLNEYPVLAETIIADGNSLTGIISHAGSTTSFFTAPDPMCNSGPVNGRCFLRGPPADS